MSELITSVMPVLPIGNGLLEQYSQVNMGGRIMATPGLQWPEEEGAVA